MTENKLSESEYAKQYVEAQKVVFDYIKHLTTLNTGAIAILAIFLEKFFKSPHYKIVIILSFVVFIISIVFLSLSALGIIRSIRTPSDVSDGLVRFTSLNFILGIISFIVGILSIAILVIKNML